MEDFFDVFTFNFFLIFIIGSILFYMLFWMPVTKTIIRDTYKNHGVLIDPHTAVGIGVVKKIPLEGNTVVLATAHPAKFPEVVMESTGIKPELP